MLHSDKGTQTHFYKKLNENSSTFRDNVKNDSSKER